MFFREISEKDKEAYNQVVSHPVQSWEWGRFRQETGVEVLRLGQFDGEKLVSAFQIFFHRVPRLNFTVGYLPRAPLPDKKILSILTEIGKERNCVFIKFEPDCLVGQKDKRKEYFLRQTRPGRPVLPINTINIDLTPPEEEILRQMHEKTRYNIRLSQKQGVRVEEKNDDSSLSAFLDFLEETEKRQGFYTHPRDYFKKQWAITRPSGMAHLLLAFFGTFPLAGIMLFHFQDKLYYPYGGSSLLHRAIMPNYSLHWEAIRLGKRLGCKTYDLWGTYWQKPEPTDPWYGVYRFKMGFGGKPVSYLGAFDLVLNLPLYRAYNLTNELRWQFLKISRKLHLQ
ncbi:peptidoglycan bridge formation glycyltransferase FemA/FemB family protein [Candidatus Shapirobacteria bacterium]|nr:peptidoglycan bridge formation glycyltransferase FemA/FemB family protein [Candidatus Shapirobacteria bacterium]